MSKFKEVFKVKIKTDKILYIHVNEYEYKFKIEEIHNEEVDVLFNLTISKQRILKLSIALGVGTTIIGGTIGWVLKLFV
ncbi:hypothetical protein [Bacillus cereus group sp. BfR-BA-01495]|uniref:hypothetical protein n=1 Tax=Bacillus cereus group sp. BfR-BA-01495 TaxID=2920363 RepID=UPI001F55FDEC|nr:hypothetical protein [Bacillus cereus group sp. BfR-BA-01495]